MNDDWREWNQVSVPVPAGIEDGQTVRMPVGNKEVFITFKWVFRVVITLSWHSRHRVEKSDYFTRKGADVHTEAHISLAQVSEMLFLILTIVNVREHQTEKQLYCFYRLPWEELFGFREFMKTSTCRYPLAPHPTQGESHKTWPTYCLSIFESFISTILLKLCNTHFI